MDLSPKRVVQTARGIQAIVDKGEPGDRLPSEIELARQLTVSRATVRDALSQLWLKGLVTRRWGAGTFISERRRPLDAPVNRIFLDLEEIGSLPRLIADSGHVPSMAAFASSVVVPPSWVVEEFGLTDGDQVRRIERCLAIDGRAALLLRDYVPLIVRGTELQFDGLEGMQTDFPSLFRHAGLRLVKQAEHLNAVLPDDGVSALLGIATSEPVLHAQQRSYADTGETVICTDSFYVTTLMSTVLVRTISG